ncbi:uncharacterized protein Moror_2790 [Moniliophthora roreri MCA 2997]|uniref:PH domain-containing protein n=1 Tax=Moniliophthora roreri (strain MCA 2997) TaxID=1381753 RepID=V2XC83_MONRO|nr:uncharacterized protein Moror_2790 [Moniliophthora roreri MCA 2997]KAI3598093.1 uncharacterized protein WG66_009127 [Moniliophthora roreri]
MEESLRSQSITRTRNSSFQFKASKIFQKVTQFRGRLRLSSSRKTQDDRQGPYMMGRRTGSMDLNSHMAAKPYMSQPVLGNIGNDGSESYSSNSTTSPNYSPRRAEISIPDHQEALQRSAPANVSRHAVAMGVVNGTAVGMAVSGAKGLSIEGLPSDTSQTLALASSNVIARGSQPSGLPSSVYQPAPHFSQTKVTASSMDVASDTQLKGTNESLGDARTREVPKVQEGSMNTRNSDVFLSHSSNPAKPRSQGTDSASLASVNSDASRRNSPKITKVSSGKGKQSMDAGPQAIPIQQAASSDSSRTASSFRSVPSTIVAEINSDTRPSTAASALSTSTTSSSATVTPRTYRKSESADAIPPVPPLPGSITQAKISNNVPPSQHSAAAPPHPKPSVPLTPPRLPTSPLSASDSASLPPHDVPSSSTFPSRRPFTAPRLTSPLPGHTRFSLTEGDGASARLSPSIIIRQPAWPILRLPPVEQGQSRPSTSPGPSSLTSPLGGTFPYSDESGEPSSVGRRGSITTGPKLRHMPALPMAGQKEEGDEDDLADEDESSSEDDSEDNGAFLDIDDGEDDEGDDVQSIRRPSTDAQASTSRGGLGRLPMVDTSRIDLSFIDRDKDEVNTPKATASSIATRTPKSGQQGNHDYFSGVFPSTQSGKTPRATPFSIPFAQGPAPLSIAMPPMPKKATNTGLIIHKQASKSMFDLSATMDDREDRDGLLDHAAGIRREEEIKPKAQVSTPDNDITEEPHNRKASVASPGTSASKPIPIPTLIPADQAVQGSSNGSSGIGTPASPQLRRRRSMPLFTPSSPPPPYPSFAPLYPLAAHSMPPPAIDAPSSLPPILHGEEGNERLPSYTNDIYLRAVMPRKMEFSKPNVQAKDRKWRRVVCELEGTVFRVYRCPAKWVGSGRSGKVVDWWERKVGVGDASVGVGIGGGAGGAINSSAPGGEGGTVGVHLGGDGEDEAERARRRRQQKLDGGDDGSHPETAEIRLSPRTIPLEQTSRGRMQDRDGIGRGHGQDEIVGHRPKQASRSRLANLLKPGKSHGRSNSDVSSNLSLAPPSGADSPPSRSSFNLPRPSFAISRSGGSGSTTSHSENSIIEEPRNSASLRRLPSRQSLTGSSQGQTQDSERQSVSMTRSRSGTGTTSGSTDPPLRPGASCPEPGKEDLIKAYTLQNAESGLGNDYVKRKNVIRVRMEGEQFLIQARDVPEVVSWIEGLHAAANIALDLDDRPMPRGPLFPRRRRRRPRRTGTDASTNGNEAQASEGRTGALDPRQS